MFQTQSIYVTGYMYKEIYCSVVLTRNWLYRIINQKLFFQIYFYHFNSYIWFSIKFTQNIAFVHKLQN